MFENIGSKIKKLAKVLSIIGIIVSVIIGLYIMSKSDGESPLFFIGFLVAIIGSILSWVSGFFVYGFGELIIKTQEIAQNTRPKNNSTKPMWVKSEALQNDSESPVPNVQPSCSLKSHSQVSIFRCGKCGNMITHYPCESCGFNSSFSDK